MKNQIMDMRNSDKLVSLQEMKGPIEIEIYELMNAFRSGGEEFVIVIEDSDSVEAFKFAENLRKQVENSNIIKELTNNMKVTISSGIAAFSLEENNINEVLEKADKALYYSKINGRNQTKVYSKDCNYTPEFLSNEILKETLFNAVESLVSAVDARASYTGQHSQAVMKYSMILAKGLEFSDNDKEKLTSEEFEIIKKHTTIGYNIVKYIIQDEAIRCCIKNHHERWNGSGYPDKLAGNKIHLYARIVSVADAFHAMTSDRPYRKGMTKEEAICELVKNKGTQFDPIMK